MPVRFRTVVGVVGGLLAGASGCAFDAPAGDALEVVRTAPVQGGHLPADAPVLVDFDRYLAPLPVDPSGITLASGGSFVDVAVLYDPVARGLNILPADELLPGLAYTLTLSPQAVRGLDGATLAEPVTLDFVAEAAAPVPPPPPVDFERDLAPLFAARCGCHGPAPLAYPELTPAALVDAPSLRQPPLALVVPGAPLRSFLVRKLLPGYPGVQGADMPPDEPPLTPLERRRVIDWVAGLGTP